MDLVFGPPLELEVDGESGLGYFHSLRERLREVHKLVRRGLHKAGAHQKQAAVPRVKLARQRVVLCTTVADLSDVVYQVQLVGWRRTVVIHRDQLAL